MKCDDSTAEIMCDRAVNLMMIILVVIATMILILRILTHFPFFDETLHLNFLWLISSGFKPNTDFLCTYPVLGYIVSLPFMQIFPESAFVVLALRCLSFSVAVLIGYMFYRHGSRISNDPAVSLIPYIVVIAGSSVGTYMMEYSVDHFAALAALGAMTLLLGNQRPVTVAFAAALSIISLLIMPKFAPQLFFCLLGGAAACYLQTRRLFSVAGALIGGGGAALILILLLFYLTDISFADSFRYSHLLQYRHSKLLGRVGGGALGMSGLANLSGFLLSYPVLGLAILLGTAGWLKRSAREKDFATILPAGGLLCGTLFSSILISDFLEQYTAPLLFSLALLVAYSGALFPVRRHLRIYRLLLAAASIITVLPQLPSVAQEFVETPYNARGDSVRHRQNLGEISKGPPGVLALNAYAELLEILPKSETVVAVWPYHPIFRRHPGFVTFDVETPLASALPVGDPIRHEFEAARFREALEKRPPGFIITDKMEVNYPTGWKVQAEAFLKENAERYVLRKTRYYEGYIRRDLVK